MYTKSTRIYNIRLIFDNIIYLTYGALFLEKNRFHQQEQVPNTVVTRTKIDGGIIVGIDPIRCG